MYLNPPFNCPKKHTGIRMEYLWIILSFMSGSLPFAVIIAKTCKGIDPRKEGSKNPGTTNVSRLCGLPYGILTLLCDVLKGTIPVYTSMIFFSDAPYAWVQSTCALAAVIGHIKSPFLHFKGGKGVATGIGVLLPLSLCPLLMAVLCCLIVIALSGYVSAGALTLYAVLPFCYYFFDAPMWIPLSLAMICIIFWTHRQNVRRLLRGEEKSWRKSRNPS